MVQVNFNAQEVAPNTALEAIPSGVYPVIITNSEEKPNGATSKDPNGTNVVIEMTVQGGEFNGRKVFDRLNLNNQNQQAVDIAYATLSALCHVTGKFQITDTAQLHGIPFQAVVTKRKRDDRPGEDLYSNDVKGYKDINGMDPGKGGTVASSAAQPGWAGGASTGGAAASAGAEVLDYGPHDPNADDIFVDENGVVHDAVDGEWVARQPIPKKTPPKPPTKPAAAAKPATPAKPAKPGAAAAATPAAAGGAAPPPWLPQTGA